MIPVKMSLHHKEVSFYVVVSQFRAYLLPTRGRRGGICCHPKTRRTAPTAANWRPGLFSFYRALRAQEKENLVNSLVRYILFCDGQKLPIKRVDITKHVLENFKKFKITTALMDIAQVRLKQIMGMELVQIPKLTTNKKGQKSLSLYKNSNSC